VAENDPATWDPAPGLVTDAADLFGNSVYDRGAMTLQALRVEVGDATFLRILRDWFAEHKYANVSTADFIALAQRDSHRDLRAFFRTWLYTPGPVVTAPATAAPQPAARLAARSQRRR
jgi:aminopeptidase N